MVQSRVAHALRNTFRAESDLTKKCKCSSGSAVTACASSSSADVDNDLEKEALTCYNAAAAAACGSDDQADTIIVQSVPMLVQIPGTN